MITGDLKTKIGAVWNDFWSGGISNPLEVMEQLTLLLFVKGLDEAQTRAERKAHRTGQPIEEVIFPDGTFTPEGKTNWADEILDWHDTGRPSNGRIEGTTIWSPIMGDFHVADGGSSGRGGRVMWSDVLIVADGAGIDCKQLRPQQRAASSLALSGCLVTTRASLPMTRRVPRRGHVYHVVAPQCGQHPGSGASDARSTCSGTRRCS